MPRAQEKDKPLLTREERRARLVQALREAPRYRRASFYSWPTVANVKAWKRQAGKRNFVYTVKVCEHITHIKKFKGTKTTCTGRELSCRQP
jgi:hypothetical protein